MATTNTLLTKTPAVIAAVRPKLVRHPLARPGSKFIFDFTDARCHPNGVITPGAAAAGYTLNSLVGNVTAKVVGAGATVNADGSISTLGGTSYIAIGAAGQFDMSGAPYEFIGTFWFKFAADASTTAYWRLIDGEASANEGQFYFDAGTGGRTPRSAIGFPATTGSDAQGQNGPARAVDTIIQLVQYFKPGAKHALLVNGAETNSSTNNIPATLRANPGTMGIGRGANGRITSYGVSLHDIAASIAQETAINVALTAAGKPTIMVREYAAHAAYDYQFGKGQIAAAPKTAYA